MATAQLVLSLSIYNIYDIYMPTAQWLFSIRSPWQSVILKNPLRQLYDVIENAEGC